MTAFTHLFSAQVFLIILRETLESAIIISVLLAFVNRSFTVGHPSALASSLRLQIILGAAMGLSVCLVIGIGIIYLFYKLSVNYWSLTEHYWEGLFSIMAAVIISAMGFGMMRVERWKAKWERKLTGSVDPMAVELRLAIPWRERHAMFVLPFITTLREGLEAVVFVGGVGMSDPVSSLPASFLLALILGMGIGVVIYRCGTTVHLRLFLVLASCLLYLVAAGLFSKGIWQLELQRYINLCNGQDMSEVGSGPGSYDISNSVWHVNCCNGEIDGGWMLVSAIFGWTNSATYGSVVGYNLFWVCIIVELYRRHQTERALFLYHSLPQHGPEQPEEGSSSDPMR